MSQVHKETLSAVDNALPNRAGLDIEIFGMEGIPEDVVQAHNQRVLTQFHQQEAERRAASGSMAAGGGAAATGAGAKKPKFESPADIKKRLAEHKAKMAAEQNGASSGGGTPQGVPSPAAVSTFNPMCLLKLTLLARDIRIVSPTATIQRRSWKCWFWLPAKLPTSSSTTISATRWAARTFPATRNCFSPVFLLPTSLSAASASATSVSTAAALSTATSIWQSSDCAPDAE